MAGGRPTDYTPELADEICARIAQGQSVRSLSQADDMPGERTIYTWLFNNQEFQQKYARAREAQADVFAERINDIASTPLIGEKTSTKDDGGKITTETVRHDAVDRSRLQVDSLKWLASKLKPKKYGDKTAVEHSGTIGLAAILEDIDGGSADLPSVKE